MQARAAYTTNLGSRPLGQHEHFALVDLIFRKAIRTGFRFYLNFRVGKTRLDCSGRLVFVWNGYKKYFLAHSTTGASARPHGADLPALCHGLV
jgi:hypothetical protein